MTVNDVIKHVIPVLEGIKVPMTEVEAIGLPVSAVINDLKNCVAFMDRVEQEAREKAEQEEAEKAEQEAAEQAASEEAPEEEQPAHENQEGGVSE